MANIGELPYQVLGTAPKFGLREEIVKKIALHVQNVIFYLLIGLVSFDFLAAVAVVAPRIYRCA